MKISYIGHSCFRLKNKKGIVITDPFDEEIGLIMPRISADIVTVSHDHQDHNNVGILKGTARRDEPFVIKEAGEYEIGGISVFGVSAFHDAHQGEQRGKNVIYTILMSSMRICHLGDLGHELNEKLIKQIGLVDILFIPVGGVYTIGPKQAVKVARSLEPSIVIPMHFKTEHHKEEIFGKLHTVKDFQEAFGAEVEEQTELNITRNKLPEELELKVLKVG